MNSKRLRLAVDFALCLPVIGVGIYLNESWIGAGGVVGLAIAPLDLGGTAASYIRGRFRRTRFARPGLTEDHLRAVERVEQDRAKAMEAQRAEPLQWDRPITPKSVTLSPSRFNQLTAAGLDFAERKPLRFF